MLNHYLDVEWLREAYHRLRKDSAPGVDGQTVSQYGQHFPNPRLSASRRRKHGRACPRALVFRATAQNPRPDRQEDHNLLI